MLSTCPANFTRSEASVSTFRAHQQLAYAAIWSPSRPDIWPDFLTMFSVEFCFGKDRDESLVTRGVDGDESLVTQPKRRPWFGGLDRRKVSCSAARFFSASGT